MQIDITKKVFLSKNCIEEERRIEYIKRVLKDLGMPKNRIFEEVDMDILTSGDYLIRWVAGEIKAYEIILTLPFGFTTHVVDLFDQPNETTRKSQ